MPNISFFNLEDRTCYGWWVACPHVVRAGLLPSKTPSRHSNRRATPQQRKMHPQVHAAHCLCGPREWRHVA